MPKEPSAIHKLCRLEIHPDDMHMYDAKFNETETIYSHAHLKKYATLVEEST